MLKHFNLAPFGARSFTILPRSAQKQNSLFDSSLLKPLGNKSNPVRYTNAINGINDMTSMLSPREDAFGSKLTGIKAGRTVAVYNGNTMQAFFRLQALVKSNHIALEKRKQRFYLKPGKVRELRKSQKHRRDFMKGFKRLISVVKDAKRKGY